MNDIIKNILTRRSVRKFSDKEIGIDDINIILKSALYAPSGMGKQTWKFTAISNKEKIQKLASAVGEVLSRENYDMYNPTLIIIPSNEKDSIWGKEDNACALENIFLSSHSLGIGSVWINQLQGICDNEKIRKILDEFDIPRNHTVYGIASLGYPLEEVSSDIKKNGQVNIIR